MKVLETLSCTIDTKILMNDICDINLQDLQYLVAYGTPDIPLALRKEKPFFHSSDCEEFFFDSDKDYKIFWGKHIKNRIPTKYLVPLTER